MKTKILLAFFSTLLAVSANSAPLVSPSNIPLETGTAATVKPNIMFILDDSGSMDWEFLGDEVSGTYCHGYSNTGAMTSLFPAASSVGASRYLFLSACSSNTQTGEYEVPFAAYDFNKVYYNPNMVYKSPPANNSIGQTMADQSFYNAKTNGFLSSGTMNLSTMTEVFYCTKSAPSAAELLNTSICRRNGVENVDAGGTFDYYVDGYPNGVFKYKYRGPRTVGGVTMGYFSIVPKEYCDSNFENCSSTSTGTMTNPANVRWCKSPNDAISPSLVTGLSTGSARCTRNYSFSYPYPRYGRFKRNNLVASELGNFANWYSYYRDRLSSMKSSLALSFNRIDDKTRVGFITINAGVAVPVSSSNFLKISDFNATHKQKFYNTLYAATPIAATPLRESLSRVGRYFAGITATGMIDVNNPDPVQYSCQQNFAILSTDGITNGGYGIDLNGNVIGNQDNTNSGYSTRSVGAYDGGVATSSNLLADVAMYYYKTDLRTVGPVSANNVPVSATDTNSAQHMVTYTISLGQNGLYNFTPNYVNGLNPDFEAIKAGTKNWPGQLGLDDLWHTAVNGRGVYYSAQNSVQLADNLNSLLSSVLAQTGSSASATTSSPNITATDNYIYSSTYRTVTWDGEIKSNTIDPTTGDIMATLNWSAKELLNTQTTANADTRNLYFIHNAPSSSVFKSFDLSNFDTTETSLFTNKCSASLLSQCSILTPTQKTNIDNGTSILKFLRGQRNYEKTNTTDPLYKTRDYILGDIVNSNLSYVAKPTYSWTDSGYDAYVTAKTNRTPMIYAGANDGFLHAFTANSGVEQWAIAPRQTMGKMYKLADHNYFMNHEFFIDGNMQTMDVQIGGSWRTVLVSGFGAGSKGYFAIDITDPLVPKPLWEICTDSTVCSVAIPNMGYSFGNPIITKRYFDDRWVAYLTSGYDNANGNGEVYEIDIATGALLRTLTTGVGTASSPSGLAKANAYFEDFAKNNKAKFLYAGDMDGNLWKWDLTAAANTSALLLGVAKDSFGTTQPITTTPELGMIDNKLVIFIGTGKFLSTSDFTTTQTQSVYAIKDTDTQYGTFRTNASFVNQVLTSNGSSSTSTANAVDWVTNGGWYFDLTSAVGERVNVEPKLTLGVLNIVSNIPGASECSMGGSSWIYQVNYKNGGYIDSTTKTVANKSIGGLTVGQVIVQLGKFGGLKNYITDASGAIIKINVGLKSSSNSVNAKKLYWKELQKK